MSPGDNPAPRHLLLVWLGVVLLAAWPAVAARSLVHQVPEEPLEMIRALLEERPVHSYGDPTSALALDEPLPLRDALLERLRAGRDLPARQFLEHEPALDHAARSMALYFAEHEALPSDSYLQWLAWQLGVTAQVRLQRYYWGRGRRHAESLSVLEKLAGQIPVDQGPMLVGVAFNRLDRRRWIQTACVMSQPVVLEPLAKHHEPGSSLTIEGRFAVAARDARLYIGGPAGPTEIYWLGLRDDGSFAVELQLPQQPGTWYLQLRARSFLPREDETGELRTLLHFPLYLGVDEPSEPERWRHQARWPVSEEDEIPERVLAVYNRERSAAGLPALELDPVLSEEAASWAEVLARGGAQGAVPRLQRRLLERGEAVVDSSTRWSGFVDLEPHLEEDLLRPAFRDELLDPLQTRLGVATTRPGASSAYEGRILVRFLASMPVQVEARADASLP